MPKTDVTAFAARAGELIATNAIHAICLILAFVPVPFIFYYITELHLWGTDIQFIFETIAFIAGIGILIYAGLRAAIWLLCAIVPVIVWLLYITVHGLAWLLRTVIVPGTLWLLSVALPAMASRLYAAACGLMQRLRNKDWSLNTRWPDLQNNTLQPQTLLLAWRNMVSRTTVIRAQMGPMQPADLRGPSPQRVKGYSYFRWRGANSSP